jgi:redox-sensitive bicupin YhaK (pirin superfamily)
MNPRSILRRVHAMPMAEGAGVTVHRSLGLPALPVLDPFLMLDHFASTDPDDYIAGFPDHPHRGFVTLTYMLDGHMEHRDSMGNRGDLRAGGVQWMKAGSGVIHSEMPRQSEGLMRGFQLWINLPAAQKMTDPEWQEIPAPSIPDVEVDGSRVRLVSGRIGPAEGPVQDPHTDLLYLDAALPRDGCATLPVAAGAAAFIYPFEGQVRVGGLTVRTHELAVLGDGDTVEVASAEGPARCLLVAGRPLGEPVVQEGPFVMNTREEIEQAVRDLRDGRLVRATR